MRTMGFWKNLGEIWGVDSNDKGQKRCVQVRESPRKTFLEPFPPHFVGEGLQFLDRETWQGDLRRGRMAA